MSSTGVVYNDGRVENRVENYTKFWKKDPTTEGEADNDKRLESYTDVVNGELFFPLKRRWNFYLLCLRRLLRRRDRAVRIRLVAILPLLALLQGRSLPRLARPT